jgi:hypothetical protein
MTDPPFSIGLRLSLEMSRDPAFDLDHLVEGWRESLVPIEQLELISRTFRPDVVPAKADAQRVLSATFADHPMVNVSRRTDRAATGAGAMGPTALVVAEIVLLPELAPIPPGGEFPNVSEEVVSDPHLVHARPWRAQAEGEAARDAGREILEQVISALPEQLWRREG